MRLAIAYAPGQARSAWTALLAFDHRLSRAVAGASSPLLAQLKLAWWRDRMRTAAATWPVGEPLLAALTAFDGERPALEALIDGWEGLVGDDADENALARLVEARTGAVAALARVIGCPVDGLAIAASARRWTMPCAAIAVQRLPRALRPLLILANLPPAEEVGALALLRIVRLGMFGR
ncbi:squalene/phytoene synthase family protein [Novosphingobium sp. Gsoil 351]|uniref:squalene/phytoene synthase family protein n=1 Tax=Novosphingobium sp. Gsoil 351 TaxID=2675225 RepID=UPI0012B4B505|nr:squalene/phytoene synthase family protein [Novosphingobium sp. Gsoil 351]QGN53809.1 hypothetical protein GKE62_03905 [Novosphingobium sp. Gsoil 351]